jgi:crotonobetainyl-CoA:carnitine CoA-transferase CaiB-like acyl-CoA transferase
VRPLEGLVVAQFGSDPAIDFTGWVFAQSGATVLTAVDPSPGPWGQCRDAFRGAGKTHVSLQELTARSADADVAVAGPELDWTTVAAPALTGSVTAFPEATPYSGWSAGEAVLASLGGATAYTTSQDGVPVYGFGDRYQYLTGWLLYTALVSCLVAGESPTPRTPTVVINQLEAVTYLLPYGTAQVDYNGSVETVEQSGPRFVSRCLDGHVAIYAGGRWGDVAALLGDEALEADPRFLTPAARFRHVAELDEILAAWCARQTVASAELQALRHSVAISRIMTLDDVLADDHLRSEDVWQSVATADGRSGLAPRLPYRIDGLRPSDPR